MHVRDKVYTQFLGFHSQFHSSSPRGSDYNYFTLCRYLEFCSSNARLFLAEIKATINNSVKTQLQTLHI